MTDARIIDLQRDNDELLLQIKTLQNDVATHKARLHEAIDELSRWKIECLDRRQRMIAQQKESLVRVPFMGSVKS